MRLSASKGTGQGRHTKAMGIQGGGIMYTLNSTEVHCVAYSIHSYNSEGVLRSKTPYAHEVDKARTLDLITGNPDCNQGGEW